MKDKHGTFRGKCSCGCIEYKTVIGSQSPKCTTCGHSPVKHVSYGTVSACRKCDCQNFESELGDFDICAYCECPIQDHSTSNEEIPTTSPSTSYSHHTVNNETNAVTFLHNSTIDTGLKQFQHQPGLHFASTIQPGLHFASSIQPDTPLNSFGASNATQQSQLNENNQNYTFPPPLRQFQPNTSPQQLPPAVNHVPNTQYTFKGTGILENSMQGNDQASNFPVPFVTNSSPQNMMPGNHQTFNFAGVPIAANIPENSMQGNNQSANFQPPFGSFNAPDNMNIMNPVNQIQQQNQLFNSPQQPQHLFDNCNNQFQAPHQQQQFAGSPTKCSIPECLAPCYVDQYTGQVHACCSLVHEMENQRRKAMGSNLVKGITHCLLPECSKHVWPFMNYCGKTHANVGQSKGLIPPDPATSQPNVPKKQISGGTCALPSCNRPRYLENDIEHPYCGKNHAQEGVKQGLKLGDLSKPEDKCLFPGCWKTKFVDNGVVHSFCSKSHKKEAEQKNLKLALPEGNICDLPECNQAKLVNNKEGEKFDYCSKSHAIKDQPRRDESIITSRAEVDKWLKTFPNLKITDIQENKEAKPGGVLFEKFKDKYKKLPAGKRNTVMAFHGTQSANIDSICKNGYNSALRSGQAHGPGEYFATTPDVSLSYCRGGKKMLVNELLLGNPGTDHTQHGNIIVMKDSAHDLPRFVISFA